MDANGWIRASEQLPERLDIPGTKTSKNVWVYAPECDYTYFWQGSAWYNFRDMRWYDDFDMVIGNVTHWRELPPPPVDVLDREWAIKRLAERCA